MTQDEAQKRLQKELEKYKQAVARAEAINNELALLRSKPATDTRH